MSSTSRRQIVLQTTDSDRPKSTLVCTTKTAICPSLWSYFGLKMPYKCGPKSNPWADHIYHFYMASAPLLPEYGMIYIVCNIISKSNNYKLEIAWIAIGLMNQRLASTDFWFYAGGRVCIITVLWTTFLWWPAW